MQQPAVHNRPGVTTLWKLESPQHLVFTMEVKGRQAVKSWTHETSLDLYRPAEKKKETLYLHLIVWKQNIFRVFFSDHAEMMDRLSNLPEDMKMLIDQQQTV